MLEVVECANEHKNHLLVESHNIIVDTEDDSSEFTSDGDCVSSIVRLLLLISTLVHKVPVDHLGLDLSAQLDEKSSVLECFIVEPLDWLDLTDPSEKIFFGFRSDDLKCV